MKISSSVSVRTIKEILDLFESGENNFFSPFSENDFVDEANVLLREVSSHQSLFTLDSLCATARKEDQELLVFAQRRGMPLGMAHAALSSVFDQPLVTIRYVAVDSNFRRMGIGNRLMQDLITFSCQRWQLVQGTIAFELTSRVELGAELFYRNHGFVPVSQTVRYRKIVG